VTERPVVDPAIDGIARSRGRANAGLLSGSIAVMSSAVLRWTHCRGGPAHCLARARVLDAGPDHRLVHAIVVLSEVRDNPRGRWITADVPGVVMAARAALLPASCAPAAVTWFVHHGQFSTYDPAGPETLTRLAPRWDGQFYTDDVHDHVLLDSSLAAGLLAMLGLPPVEHELRGWPAPITVELPPRSPAE